MEITVPAKLDPGFSPLSLVQRDYVRDALASGKHNEFIVSIERNSGFRSSWRMLVMADGAQRHRTIALLDRIVKSLLWIYGGFRITVCGSHDVYEHILSAYRPDGSRAFDADFMSRIYEHPFEVLYSADPDDIPPDYGTKQAVGLHLNGCRIGFDAGGSDRKVSAVINGETVYSEEVVWFPKTKSDPAYHYDGILASFRSAAAHLPRVDAIGVSSAGIFVNNRVMASSLFLRVSSDDFDKHIRSIYIDAAREIGDIPLEVANDGDVTALAGAMELGAGNVLGIAMGTSEAGGYVDSDMNITGWLNELAFVPVDAGRQAMVDEWSGDCGCGVKYFSQDAVIKLMPAAGIPVDSALPPAELLKIVQREMAEGNPGAAEIYETIGVYLGYSIAYYNLFYLLGSVMIMGRVTSGDGGTLILSKAREVLETEFPEIAARVRMYLPDEKSRRVGQSAAAASLPAI